MRETVSDADIVPGDRGETLKWALAMAAERDRLKDEVERVRAAYEMAQGDLTLAQLREYAEKSLRDKAEAEVERLRDGPMARVNAELRAEVERLRSDAQGANIILERTVEEVERLRARLESIIAIEGSEQLLPDVMKQLARQALEGSTSEARG